MQDWLQTSVAVIGEVWPSALLGGVVLIVASTGGWLLSHHPAVPAVRAIDWWIRAIVLPLLRRRGFLGRAALIFINNILILAVLVVLGPRPGASILATLCVGLSLGIAFRLLLENADEALAPRLQLSPADRRKVTIGMTLNMLEPPAILLALGLSLGQWIVPVPIADAWQVFAIIVLPAMLIAAIGEGLWLGAGRNAGPKPE